MNLFKILRRSPIYFAMFIVGCDLLFTYLFLSSSPIVDHEWITIYHLDRGLVLLCIIGYQTPARQSHWSPSKGHGSRVLHVEAGLPSFDGHKTHPNSVGYRPGSGRLLEDWRKCDAKNSNPWHPQGQWIFLHSLLTLVLEKRFRTRVQKKCW